jgi:hypothetical protein
MLPSCKTFQARADLSLLLVTKEYLRVHTRLCQVADRQGLELLDGGSMEVFGQKGCNNFGLVLKQGPVDGRHEGWKPLAVLSPMVRKNVWGDLGRDL